jgi:hypothetical protein
MRNLSTKGLSMSQAQSISNMCNQRAQEITRSLMAVNNTSRTLKIEKDTYTEQEGVPMPANVTDLILEKAGLHACQGFLMEAIKAKDAKIQELRERKYRYDVPKPQYQEVDDFEMLEHVDESWGWAQLTDAEYNEYLEKDSLAAHVGQFIHKGGKLDQLRDELPRVSGLDWITVKTGEKTPVKVTKHHTSEQLLALHEQLASLHRELEQRVNYYKAKVKNLVTMENARRSAENAKKGDEFSHAQAKLDTEYRLAMQAWQSDAAVALQHFEQQRELEIKDVAALRINVDPRFQTIVDMFLVKSED